MIIAPSGVGKSTASIQAAVLWSCGKSAFNIPTPYLTGLKILIVQAEDDDGDISEMAKVVYHLDLTNAQMESVRRNTMCRRINSASGAAFSKVAEPIIQMAKPDLVILNPLNSYLGNDEKDTKACMEFRDGPKRFDERYNFGSILVHHTPKNHFQFCRDNTRRRTGNIAGLEQHCLQIGRVP